MGSSQFANNYSNKNKFRNKYRIESARKNDWNYSFVGSYFITICTKNRIEYFGYSKNNDVQLTKMGILAQMIWLNIPYRFPNILLDEFVIMPNHVHGILIVISGIGRDAINRVSTSTTNNRVSTDCDNINLHHGGITGKYNPMGTNSIGEIIRWYKGRCSYEINKQFSGHCFQWQPRFYDRIIRNYDEYLRIKNYISENPKKYHSDKNNPFNS